jgi:hypothetical protein
MSIIKHAVNIPSKTLRSGWTVFVDEFTTGLAEDIQYETDWAVLSEILKTVQPTPPEWTEIHLSDAAKKAGREEVKRWCEEKIGHGFFLFSRHIRIAREEDVVLFMLRWS